jgi:hypothetical protein
MPVVHHGLYFSVTLRERMTLEEAATEVSSALGAALSLSTERGTQGDCAGELIGLHLWLSIAEPAAGEIPPRFMLLGGPDHDLDDNATHGSKRPSSRRAIKCPTIALARR